MPKNPATQILKRWIDLDAALASPKGLHIALFARHWKVSAKTVRRDLAAFRELEQVIEPELYEGERQYVWRYANGIKRLFVCNRAR